MKIFKQLIVVAFVSLSFIEMNYAQTDDFVDVDTKITDVTVFLRGAQIERSGSKSINEGVSKLRFSYLSPDIDPNSIKVNGTGAVTILSVSHGIDHLREGRTHAKVKMLQDSIDIINTKLEMNRQFQTALDAEWNMVVANQTVNNNAGFDVEDVDDLAMYYRERLGNVIEEKQKINQDDKTLQKIQTKLRNQIGELNSKWNKSTSEIIVEVKANARTAARINLSYVVRNAGWVPNYDIRVKDASSPMALNYKAKVYQNSGVDWDNVKLKLSTGNPMKNATQPTMYPWRLAYLPDYNEGIISAYEMAPGRTRDAAKSEVYYEADFSEDESLEEVAIGNVSQFTQMTESQVNTNFEIAIPYTIDSDGQYHDVNIQSFDLPSEYRHFAAPKLDNEAFLLAKVTGWDKLNLLPGQANIFFEGTYTGKSYINPNSTSDTLELSLGRDPSFVIERKKVDEFCKAQTIGSNKTETVGIKITLRNTKSTAVVVDLSEQVPISTNKEIEVEILEISGAKHDLVNGYLDWEVNLQPGETKSYLVKYTVKYPKDKRVNL